MERNYNVTKEQRKAMVAKIAEFTGSKPQYLGMPTMAYKIGNFEVDRYGTLSWEDWDEETAQELNAELEKAGFRPERPKVEKVAEEPTKQDDGDEDSDEETVDQEDSAETSAEAEQEDAAGTEESTGLSISLPDDLSDESFENLQKVVASKQTLMRHAFQTAAITVNREDGQIVFSGFTASDGDHTGAYLQYITLLTRFAKEAKRVTGKDYPVDNEKFAFRCFILRIGMIGPEFKKARKILLENLTGNSSWKNGAPDMAAAPAENTEETEVA